MKRYTPDPSTDEVRQWLSSLRYCDVQNKGWIHINREFHGIAMAMRTHLNERFADPDERAAAFYGLTAGLLTLNRFQSINDLKQHFHNLALHD